MLLRHRFSYALCAALAVPLLFWPLPGRAQALTAAQRAQLEQELQQVEAEQAQAQSQLEAAQSKSASLARDISVLAAKIKAAQLDIKAKNLLIQSLGNDISDKQSHINDLEASIAAGKQTLAELLRKMDQLDANSVVQVVLSERSVSGFFQDLDTFQSVQQGLQDTFAQLQSDEASTSAAKDALTARQNAEMDARHAIQVQQANVQADQTQEKQLLAISQGNEQAYSQVVSQKQAKAAQIRSELFSLNGAQAIPFGDAYDYATTVYKKTGVPQAFLLAIMTQESNLGKNVGTCFLTNTSDGSGVNSRTGAVVADVMKPTRDVQPFIDITSSLGLDYKSMPVSCPQSVGYGGAMGPAQFIASTWALLIDRIKSALGKSSAPNPWNPLDAFMASGLYLADLGADSTSYTAQRTAACKYYSGTTCYNAVTGRANVGLPYGNNVLALADSIQQDQIDPLQGL
ncbi:MAG: lytic murein transglycosylase [Patescibacteria group bacterium]|nr:lytic murein transglycosylase [Patescibacteria group bacterium]